MSLCTDQTENGPLEALVNFFFTILAILAHFTCFLSFFSSTYRPLKKNPICAILGNLAARKSRSLDISLGVYTFFLLLCFSCLISGYGKCFIVRVMMIVIGGTCSDITSFH